jgi:hydroxymethylbilane synthase
MKLAIGTRGSHLARTQATTVATALEALGHSVELVIISTSGDQSDAPFFGSIGAQGVFVREIEHALLERRVDIAVHSCKDLPTSSPDELTIAAIPARVDPADVLIAKRSAAAPDAGVIPLAANSVIGTASARRQSWIRDLRADLTIEPIRGNVPTRVRKLEAGYDAIVLAAAGLERLANSPLEDALDLNLDNYVVTRLDPNDFVPAPAQGALALQCRTDATDVVAALRTLDDAGSRACVTAERSLLKRVEGGCDLALGAYCAANGSAYDYIAMLERHGTVVRESARGPDPQALARTIWEALVER